MNSEFNHRTFFEFERQHRLFEVKVNGRHIWDIIRNDVYLELLWGYTSRISSAQRTSFMRLTTLLIEYLRFLYFLLFKKSTYLFFSCSRNKVGDKFYDQNLEDIYQSLKGSKWEIELFTRERTLRLHPRSTFTPIFLIRRIIQNQQHHEVYDGIINLIKKHFPRFTLTSEFIRRKVATFESEYKVYRLLLQRQKPKAVFVTQSGFQKALFKAAADLNIPLIEVQHGIIDEGHIAYNYSREIRYYENQLYLPAYYFTFSDFWTENLYLPSVAVVPMGNTAFYTSGRSDVSQIRVKQGKGLLVASSDIFGHDLSLLISKFVEKKSQTPVYFKLHPNQFSEVKIYQDKFAAYNNVKVITTEQSIYDLIAVSEAVLAIQSTAVYEALHLGRKAIIYRRNTFYRHEHIFRQPNVHLVDDEVGLEAALNAQQLPYTETDNVFFKPFDQERFNNYVSSNWAAQ